MAGVDIQNNFWPNFNVYQWPTVECGDGTSLAVKVLNEYNIPVSNDSILEGGPLENLDIKHMDALQVIKLSLFDESVREGQYFKEPHVNAEGEVEFITVPGETADLDIYQTVQTHKYTAETKGVMVTGGKPIPVRKPVEWKLIWGDNEDYVRKYDSRDMEENCNEPGFATWANVVFRDPHLNTEFEDGIDNFYDISREGNPYDKLLGYACQMQYGDKKTEDTTVTYTKQSKIIVKIGEREDKTPDLGTLQKKKEIFTEEGRKCWHPLESPSFRNGVLIPIPDFFRYEYIRENDTRPIDHFLGISSIYIIGIELDLCKGGPDKDATAEQIPENNKQRLTASDPTTKTLKLSEGEHYTIVYDETGDYKIPYVVFADNGLYNDSAEFGTDTVMTVTDGGVLKRLGYSTGDIATILPLGGVRGFIVEEVHAVVSLDIPSFEITDPRGNADEIANDLKCYLAPIVLAEPEAPIAFNGEIIDRTQDRFDSDPTTEEDLSETQFENALDIMSGAGINMEFSYLIPEYENPSAAEGDITGVEEDLRNLSLKILEYMNDESGDLETTYTCGPSSRPRLGDVAPNGVINSITYSYNDKSSYTISVNAGSKLVGGFAELGQGMYYKQQESTTIRGTIMQNEGNHVVFKVRLGGYGDVYAINTCKEIIREGDIVQCNIHNNPVGEK